MFGSIAAAFFRVLKPSPKLKISEWADKYRYLSAENCVEPGKWFTDRAEYQRGMMDAFNEPEVEEVVSMTSAQVGKTEILLNVLGFYIDQDPSPILLVVPTEIIAKDYSKGRITPMIRDTPRLAKIFGNRKTRYSGNTLLAKEYPGGRLVLVGSNAPSGLASRPIRIVLFDEIGRFENTKEGDPVELGLKRTSNFYNSRAGMSSTPGIQGSCKIEARYKNSDQRKFNVPCPFCGKLQILTWSNLKWKKKKDRTPIENSIRYECKNCRKGIPEEKKLHMVSKGKWIAEKPFYGVAGFWLNEMYSPWSTWFKMAKKFCEAKKDREKLREFVNLSLGETWAEEGIEIEHETLFNWREDYGKGVDIPDGGLVLVGAVDVQGDRVEGEMIAYGVGQESWGIEYWVVYGNPALKVTWDDVEMKLKKTYKHKNGTMMRASCVTIDSGDGNYTSTIYSFCRKFEIMRWFAVKGSSLVGKPIVPARPSIAGNIKAKLFVVGTDTAKQLIYNRLMMEDAKGPGKMHFPMSYQEEYFKMLTAEKAIFKKDAGGFTYRKWIKKRPRNEALDIRVYSLAAIGILNPNFNQLAEAGPVIARDLTQKRVVRKRNAGVRI